MLTTSQNISKKARKLALIMLVLFSLLATGMQNKAAVAAEEYDATVAIAWFDLYLDLVQETEGFTPPVASRAFGYAGVTLYEAVVPGMPDYQTLAGQLNELTALPQPDSDKTYHWPTVANSALASITRRLFANASSENLAAIDALEERCANELEPTLDPAVFSRSVAQGQSVADAIYEWSLTDGGHEGYLNNLFSDYTPPSGPGKWVSTPPDFLPALQPYWSLNRPFVLTSSDVCDPGPPPEYSESPTSEFYAEALEIYEAVANPTPEQRDIAFHWADDPGESPTPPGHSISILNQVLEQEGASLAVAAEAYARSGIALADAFIGAWHTKYEYNLIRPVTYIQKLIDPDWIPPVTTPPFPEYTSGHSVQAGAAMQVLTDMFGDDYSFTDYTHDERGFVLRSFNSFFECADEAAISRLYGGIHYRSAIELGLEQGKCIGQHISALEFKK